MLCGLTILLSWSICSFIKQNKKEVNFIDGVYHEINKTHEDKEKQASKIHLDSNKIEKSKEKILVRTLRKNK